jgi:signal transduction histidine kinase
MHSYAPYQARSSIRRRSITFDGLQPAVALNAYVAALDVTTEAVMIIDRASLVLYANAAAEALFGGGSLVGRRLLSLYPLERRALRNIVSELQKTSAWRSTLCLRMGSAHLELETALRTVALTPGRPQHFGLVAHEPYERHGQHDQPERLDRNMSDAAVLSTVGRVAGEIAHDFNNQIAVVINYSFILLRQLPDDSPLREHVAEMQSAAWRASQVAQEMLGFSGQRSDETDDIDVNALLADVQALFTHALREDTHLEQHLGENLWRVRARRAHLEWLLVELAARMRSTMGPIKSFCITTCNSDAVSHGSQTEHARSVLISVEARPATSHTSNTSHTSHTIAGHAVVTPMKALAPNPLPKAESAGLRGTELALAHAQGELSVQQLPGGGLRYRIRLPAM